jgi:hypothetical protein
VVFRAAPAFFRYRVLLWLLSRVPLLLVLTVGHFGLLAALFAAGKPGAEPALLVLAAAGAIVLGLAVLACGVLDSTRCAS